MFILKHGSKQISIHAPAKGATMNKQELIGKIKISIHAPAKGATAYEYSLVQAIKISIHAPAKGATNALPEADVIESYFNPRSREGSDSAKLHRLWLKLINTKELLFPKIQFCH